MLRDQMRHVLSIGKLYCIYIQLFEAVFVLKLHSRIILLPAS